MGIIFLGTPHTASDAPSLLRVFQLLGESIDKGPYNSRWDSYYRAAEHFIPIQKKFFDKARLMGDKLCIANIYETTPVKGLDMVRPLEMNTQDCKRP